MQPGVKQNSLRAILFDVGNTLVFPDRQITLRPMHDRGFFPAESQIKLAESVARRTLDDQLLNNGAVSVDRGYWDIYYETLLREAGIDDEELKSQLATLSGQSRNWSILAEGAQEVLGSLRQNYALGIVSNSDERLSVLLARLGIEPFFECVIASSVVGCEKPHQRIFEAALQRMGVKAEQAVYAGDIYSVDYLGATGAGIPAVLMDVYDVYNQVDVPRVRSLRELHKLIEEREGLG